jgi:hypothetical protein
MNDLIDRKKAIQGVRELFSMGDCYCDELSIIGMLNGLESPSNQNQNQNIIDFYEMFDYYKKLCKIKSKQIEDLLIVIEQQKKIIAIQNEEAKYYGTVVKYPIK